jgi:hypothetical protein
VRALKVGRAGEKGGCGGRGEGVGAAKETCHASARKEENKSDKGSGVAGNSHCARSVKSLAGSYTPAAALSAQSLVRL